jgi:hypothetical protein
MGYNGAAPYLYTKAGKALGLVCVCERQALSRASLTTDGTRK